MYQTDKLYAYMLAHLLGKECTSTSNSKCISSVTDVTVTTLPFDGDIAPILLNTTFGTISPSDGSIVMVGAALGASDGNLVGCGVGSGVGSPNLRYTEPPPQFLTSSQPQANAHFLVVLLDRLLPV